MVLARKEFDATDEAGNRLTDVLVRVEREGGGLVPVYSDRDGTSSLGNPFTVADGKVAFHAPGGAYRITLTSGTYSRVLRYVAIGLAAETDFSLARNAGEWDSGATYARGDYVVRSGKGVFISTQDANLNHEPDASTPGSTAYWTYLPGLMGPQGGQGPPGPAAPTGKTIAMAMIFGG